MVREGEPAAKPTFRERHRAARRREFLDIAREIVNSENEAAVTMQRLSEAVGSSVGGIYIYFASRDALLAELQQEAFEILLQSYRLGREALEEHLRAAGTEPAVAALVGVLANSAFWIDSEETLPADVELSRRMIAAQATPSMEEAAAGVLPTALAILNEGTQRFDAAVDAGVLDPGNNIERSVMMVASATGVLLVSKVGGWDGALFDGRRLAREFAANTLIGWGATRDQLAEAGTVLDGFRAVGQIAPPVTPE